MNSKQEALEKDPLSFWIPVVGTELSKDLKDEWGRPLRIVKGYASIDDGKKDVAKETVDVMDGLDDTLFKMKREINGRTLLYGIVNYCHKKGAADFVGRPVEVRKDAGRYYVESALHYGGEADKLWETLSNNPPSVHGIGYSLDGGILERDGKDKSRIKRSFIHQIALTPQPLESRSFVEAVMSKGLDVDGMVLDLESKEDSMDVESVANKILAAEDEKVSVSVMERLLKAISPFGRRKSAGRMVAEAQAAVAATQPVEPLVKGETDEDNEDEEENMEKSLCKGCGKTGGAGKFCAECGEPMKKGLVGLMDGMQRDPATAKVIDADPYIEKLTKDLSASLDALCATQQEVIDPLMKALGASQILNKNYEEKTAALSAQVEALQKGVTDAFAALRSDLGIAGQTAAGAAQGQEALRKSADVTAAAAAAAPGATQGWKQTEEMAGGARLIRTRSPLEAKQAIEKLIKGVTDGKIDNQVFTLYMPQLQNLGAVRVMPEHRGVVDELLLAKS